MDELITKMKEVNDFIQSCNQNCENNIGLIIASLEDLKECFIKYKDKFKN